MPTSLRAAVQQLHGQCSTADVPNHPDIRREPTLGELEGDKQHLLTMIAFLESSLEDVAGAPFYAQEIRRDLDYKREALRKVDERLRVKRAEAGIGGEGSNGKTN
jgi:hypothetical protein